MFRFRNIATPDPAPGVPCWVDAREVLSWIKTLTGHSHHGSHYCDSGWQHEPTGAGLCYADLDRWQEPPQSLTGQDTLANYTDLDRQSRARYMGLCRSSFARCTPGSCGFDSMQLNQGRDQVALRQPIELAHITAQCKMPGSSHPTKSDLEWATRTQNGLTRPQTGSPYNRQGRGW